MKLKIMTLSALVVFALALLSVTSTPASPKVPAAAAVPAAATQPASRRPAALPEPHP